VRWTRAHGKYAAEPTVVHGVRFASKAEARRYEELLLLGAAGQLRNLELQPRFPLHAVGGDEVSVYVADFRYEERAIRLDGPGPGPWHDIIEDVKGCTTPVYRLKKKHFEAEYGRTIRETGRRR
jgi:hypothetical protein